MADSSHRTKRWRLWCSFQWDKLGSWIVYTPFFRQEILEGAATVVKRASTECSQDVMVILALYLCLSHIVFIAVFTLSHAFINCYGEKPYLCTLCGNHHLIAHTEHLQIHTGEFHEYTYINTPTDMMSKYVCYLSIFFRKLNVVRKPKHLKINFCLEDIKE